MRLQEKVTAVEQVFIALDEEIAKFQGWSGLHCNTGCGKCCFKPDIEASVLEFLPFAHFLYQQNQAFEWLDKLKEAGPSTLCLLLNPQQTVEGMCSQYKHRGLVCRLFGYSARHNKYRVKELVTCNVIKTEQTEQYISAAKKIESGEDAPLMTNYYMQLHAIDDNLAREFFPVNQAIKKAIETTLHYYAYRTEAMEGSVPGDIPVQC